MGRGLSIDSKAAKNISFPENIIAIDLYLQCKIAEAGLRIEYNDDAVVYFQPTQTMAETASQVIRSLNGHRQLRDHISRTELSLPTNIVLREVIRAIYADPIGCLAGAACFSLIPYYKRRLEGTDTSDWGIAKSTKKIDYERLKSSFATY